MKRTAVTALVTAPDRGARVGVYWWLVAAVGVWLGLILLAPFGRAQGLWMAPLVYETFHLVCHQIPERSFSAFGHPLAVCHRCSGLYVGFFAGLLLLPSLDRLRTLLIDRPRLVAVFFIPMLVDVAVRVNVPASRFLSGLIAAFPVGLLLWIALDGLLPRRSVSATAHRNEHEPTNA